jgi:hypothetical protein
MKHTFNLKNIIIILGLLILFPIGVNAQKHDYVWKMAYDMNIPSQPYGKSPILTIDFNYSSPILTLDSTLYPVMFTLSSMSDSSGNFLFYCNGNKVVDENNDIMQNGDSINFGAFSRLNPLVVRGYAVIDGVISLPNPGNQNLYDIFHIKIDSYPEPYMNPHQLLHTRVDMSLNASLGAVVFKNKLLIEDSLTRGQLQAVKHANGIDWWILVSEQNTNGYYSFLLKEDTLEGPFYQQIGRNIYSWLGYGQACFSPDGTKYARFEDDLDIYDFDRCTGELCNHRFVEIDGWLDITNRIPQGGCAFSPSGRFVYVTQLYELFQIDLWDVNPDSSLHRIDFIDINDSYPGYNLCRLAPDNKIYIGGHYDTAWSVINAPDNYGTACNTSYKSFYLGGVLDCFSLPNFPHYRMPAQDSCPPCGTFTAVPQLEVSELTSIKVYPNPAHNGRFNIAAQQSPDYLQIHDLLGRLLLEEAWDNAGSEKEIQLPSGAKGIYFVSVWKEGKLLGREKVLVLE